MPEQRYSIESRPEGLIIDITPWFKCSVHRKTVHSYISSNNVLLWSKWIVSGKYEKDRYKPIPQVVTYLTLALESSKTRKNHCLLQSARWIKDIEFSVEKQFNNCVVKFESYFSKIRKAVDELEANIFNKLNNIKEAQYEKLNDLSQKINQINEIIKKDIQNIDNLLSLNPREKVENWESIRQIKKSKDKYFKGLEFPNLDSAVIKFNSKWLAKVKGILNDSLKISLKPQEKLLKEIKSKTFKLNKVWFCHQCESMNDVSESPIQCQNWNCFKKFDLYPSIYK